VMISTSPEPSKFALRILSSTDSDQYIFQHGKPHLLGAPDEQIAKLRIVIGDEHAP